MKPTQTLNLCTAPAGTAVAGADPLLFVGKNLHVIGTKVGSLLDTERALEFAARVSMIFLSEQCDKLKYKTGPSETYL